jgi:hypothetical protein
MKNISMFLTMLAVFISPAIKAQIKVTGDGNIGINTTQPAYKLDINSLDTRFYYSVKNALHINHNGLDPRLCSNDRIVFYRVDGTGYAKIESQFCLQPADRETKENIVSLKNKGLVTISRLKGYSFNSKNDPFKTKESGLLAQDVETVIPEAVFTNDSTKNKLLNYNSIIPYLVEAIKEQQIQIKELSNRISNFQNALNNNSHLSANQPNVEAPNITPENARLEQNIPNPFSIETKINCFIPASAHSAYLYNFDVDGRQLKQFHITGKGDQVININGTGMIPGIYFYSLVIDGQNVETRKMILTK